MDKIKINLIDLDGTLLQYNSLTKYTILSMRHWRYLIQLLYFSLLRILRIIPRDMFQKNILIRMRKTNNYEDEMKKFSYSLYHDISKSILNFVLRYTDERTINILCTASPEDYVKYLAEMLGWSYLCSTLENDNRVFYHLYGENKITSLTQRYPPQHYTYHLAISDSKSDSKLLKHFQKSYYAKHGILIKNHARHL